MRFFYRKQRTYTIMHMKNTKKKTLTGLLICIFLIAALFLGGKLLFYHVSDAENIWYFSGDTAQRIENIQKLPEHALDDYDSLMVVAHPDDETIWGGEHLLNGKYVVVCITNGNNRTRRKEFAAVMKQTDSIGLMLSFPDKTHGKRNNWKSCRKEIQQSIDTIVAQKDWATIATHNFKGEYGHIHHKMTSAITTAAAKKADLVNHLYYFGTYVKAKNMEKPKNQHYLTNPLTGDELEAKLCLTKFYASQHKVMEHLGHMLPYENWIPYIQVERT